MREFIPIVLTPKNAPEAALMSQARMLPIEHILELFAHLNGHQRLDFFQATA